MQGKGLVRFFLIVMLIISVYTFTLFLPTSGVERDAATYGAQQTANIENELERKVEARRAQQRYLDSMSKETVLDLGVFKFNYLDLKNQQLALGLDLKGGMSVVMQVDLRELVTKLADDSESGSFQQALEAANSEQVNTQSDFITLFVAEYERITSNGKLAPLFQTSLADDGITFASSNGEVRSALRAKAIETVKLTHNRLKQRIDKFGVTQPNVTLDENTDRIMVELPGVDNPDRARKLLQGTAKLEFFDVYLPSEIYSRIQRGDTKLKEKEEAKEQAAQDNDTSTENDTSSTSDESSSDTAQIAEDDVDTTQTEAEPETPAGLGPIFRLLAYNPGTGQQGAGCFIGTANNDDDTKDKIIEYLSSPEVNLPKDLKLLWSSKPDTDQDGNITNRIRLYAVKTVNGGKAPLEGDVVTDARSDLDQQGGQYVVNVNMNGRNADGVSGRQIWSKMTTKAAPTQRQVAIALDDEIVSAPSVNEPITGGRTQISGAFTAQEAGDLANILQVGKLPAKPEIIEENIVGPSLGADNINSSLIAIVIGFALVLVFMMVYYGSGGIVSIIALLLNLIFIFASLAQLGTVLTLPGFAGVILTIGMAVDANVIIYERIREELREGKAMLVAIKDGFQASYSAIIDANVTTILTGFVLYYFGLGPIKGFAAILIIGVISSLFTAVLVGRLLIDWWTSKERDIAFSTKISESAFANLNFDFIKMRKTSYVVSGAIILVGIISMFTQKFQLGVDFKGGYSYAIQFENAVTADDIRAAMTTAFEEEPVVKAFGGNNTFEITTSYLVDKPDVENRDEKVLGKLFDGTRQLLGVTDTIGRAAALDDFVQGKSATHLTRSIKVGPTIADDIRTSAFYAAIFALLLIFLYIFIRFRKWQYSLGAVAALFHDVLIVLSIFSIGQMFLPFSLEINQVFIGAILTVIGYSINDTVVVFDRIREFVNAYTRKDKKEVFNLAVNNTISRTLITSLTTLFMVLMLFLFGGSSIKGFAFALVVGIIVGTYSSVFIATPIVFDSTGDMAAKEVGRKTKYGGRVMEKKAKEA